MSDSAAFMTNRANGSGDYGFTTLFAGVDGLARAAGMVFLGAFLLGVVIVLVVAAT